MAPPPSTPRVVSRKWPYHLELVVSPTQDDVKDKDQALDDVANG